MLLYGIHIIHCACISRHLYCVRVGCALRISKSKNSILVVVNYYYYHRRSLTNYIPKTEKYLDRCDEGYKTVLPK